MITKNMVREGIDEDLIRFIPDPNSLTGTVCEIGTSWFYFGGETAERESPQEYLAYSDKSDVIENVWETLNDFREDESFYEEYEYYESVIKCGLNRKLQSEERKGRLKHCPHCGYVASVKRVHDDVNGDKFAAVCLNEFCIASQNNFLYDTEQAAVRGWNYRVSPATGGFTIEQNQKPIDTERRKRGRPRIERDEEIA